MVTIMIPQGYPLYATIDTNDIQLFAVVGWVPSGEAGREHWEPVLAAIEGQLTGRIRGGNTYSDYVITFWSDRDAAIAYVRRTIDPATVGMAAPVEHDPAVRLSRWLAENGPQSRFDVERRLLGLPYQVDVDQVLAYGQANNWLVDGGRLISPGRVLPPLDQSLYVLDPADVPTP
jgi:hypothetical protein